MDKTLITLKNRLKCVFLNSKGLPTASVQVWFRAGSALERGSDLGIAHFLEHMFFKGTPRRPGPKLVREIESLGGEINAFTSFDYTCYYINTPRAHLKRAVDILMDMVSNPVFKEEDLVGEKGVVFEEFRRSVDSPNQFAFSQIQKSCFTGGYAHPILGEERTIKAFSKKQLVRFRDRFYNVQNAFVVVAGDLGGKKALIDKIESFRLPSGTTSRFGKFRLKDRAALEIHEKKTAMAALTLTLEAPDFEHPDAAAEDLAVNCLGHGESSPLHLKLVVDTPLANAVSGSTMFLNRGGAHFIKMVFPPDHLGDVLRGFTSVVADRLDGGFSEEDVAKIKNQYVASKTYSLESLDSYAMAIGHGYAQTGCLDGDDEFIERIKKTHPSEVNARFREIFRKSLHISLQLPPPADKPAAKKILASFRKEFAQKIKGGRDTRRRYRVVQSKYDPALKSIELKKGIGLLYRHNPLCPTFVLQTYIRGGLADETPSRGGCYSLLSSMLAKGYGGVGYEGLKHDLEHMSATFSGFSGKNSYGIAVHALSKDFPKLASHMFGSLLSPSFNAKIFQVEKELTFRSIERAKEDPLKICFQKIARLFFDGHPYSLAQTGTKTSVRSLKRADLRALHGDNIKTRQMLFTYCGDGELEEVAGQLEAFLEDFQPRSLHKNLRGSAAHQASVSFSHLDREQAQIFTGFKTAGIGGIDELPLILLTTHLSGQSSELFLEVRDRLGLCYAIQPVHSTALEGGYWGIYMASGHDKVDRACQAIEDILGNIRQNGISKREFATLKTIIEGQNLVGIQTNEDHANTHSPSMLYGKGIDHFYEKNRAIHRMSHASFTKAVSRILSKKRSLVVVGRRAPKIAS